MAAAKYNSGDPLNYVRWYWKDWRASTARACLSPIERGVYRELLDSHYSSPDCTIPDEDALLAGLADVPLKAWLKMRENVLRWIPLVAPGKRQHPRCLAEWERSRETRSKAVEAGQRGGRARVRNRSEPQATLERPSSLAQATLKPSASASGASSEGSPQKSDARANRGAPDGPPAARREAAPDAPPAAPASPDPMALRPGETYADRLARIRAEKAAAEAEKDRALDRIRASGLPFPSRSTNPPSNGSAA